MADPLNAHFCLFCYKTIESSVETTENSTTIKTFTSLLNRFVRNYKANELIVPDDLFEKLSVFNNLLNCCHGCQHKIEGFCKKFEQFKILEMELDWKLDKLTEKINHANKVPTRWKYVGKVLEEMFRKDSKKKTSSENTIRKLRQCVINAGQQRKKLSQPRVFLNRNENLDRELVLKKTAENIDKINNSNKNTEMVIQKEEEAKRREKAAANKKFRELYKDKICPKCGKKLTTFRGLQLHFENHKDESEWKFECKECGKKCSARNELMLHLRTHTGEKPYKCPYCRMRYRIRKSYTGHLKSVHGDEEDLEEELKRKIVPKNKRTDKILEEIEETLIEMTTFPDDDNESECNDVNPLDCDEYTVETGTFTNEDVTKTNIETENDARFKDPLIQIKYEHSSIPEDNNDSVHSFENNLSTKPSTTVPDKEKESVEFQCPKCEKRFTQKYNFKAHLEKHKNPNEWKWKCAECNKKFATSGILRHHMEIHILEKPVECQFCYKKFSMTRYLRQHIRNRHKTADKQDKTKNLELYFKSKPYKCKYCDKRYGLRINLRKHLKLEHSNENLVDPEITKNYLYKSPWRNGEIRNKSSIAVECEICTRKFTSLIKRKLHFKICHDLKGNSDGKEMVKCDHIGCKAYFLKQIQLKFHRKLEHADKMGRKKRGRHRNSRIRLEFPTCEICGKKCLTNHKLKIHMAVHTKEKKFKCKFCESKFAYLSSLGSHVKEKHENEKDVREDIKESVKIKEEYSADIIESEEISEQAEDEIRNLGNYESGRKKAQFQCQFCDKSYRLKHNLSKHFKENHWNAKGQGEISKSKTVIKEPNVDLAISGKNTNILECEICTRKFTSLLKKDCHFRKSHEMKGKTKQEVVECEQIGCKAYFLKAFQLRIHRKLEHGDQSEVQNPNNRGHFECPKCQKIYSLKASFDLHLMSHKKRSEWRFECGKCGKKWMTNAKLKIHMRVHTKEKGYKCKFCGKKFGYVSTLGIHLRAVHGDEEEVRADVEMRKLDKKVIRKSVEIKEECGDDDDGVESEEIIENETEGNDDENNSGVKVNVLNEVVRDDENEEEDDKSDLGNLTADKVVISDDNTFGRTRESFASGNFVQLEDLD